MKIYLIILIALFFSTTFISQSYDFKRKYTDPNRSEVDLFSFAVDVSGDYLVSTNTGDDEDSNELNSIDSAGSALIYKRVNNEWVLNQKITAHDRGLGDAFGTATRMEGDELFIGSVYNTTDSLGNNPLTRSGAVYVYKRDSQGQYISTQKIVAFDRNGEESFGTSIDVFEDWLVVGAVTEDKDNNGFFSAGNAPGAVYVYKRNSGNGSWKFFQRLTHPNRNHLDRFGFSCAVYNNQIAVGAYTHDFDLSETTFVQNSGAVYTYSFDGTNWVYQQKIIRASRTEGDNFGYSLDIQNDKLVIGSPFKVLNGGNNNQGVIDIYTLSGNNWVVSQPTIVYPKSIGGFPGDFNRIGAFGATITMKENNLFVAAPGESIFLGGTTVLSYGAVYQYGFTGGVYTFAQQYEAPVRNDYQIFGFPLAVDSNVLVVGAPGDVFDSLGLGSNLDSAGAFYIFEQCIHANIPQISPSLSICSGDSVQLIISSSSNLNSADKWYWYTGAYGSGTLVDSTDTVWVSPTSTTTYSVAGEGGCVASGMSDSVGTITITVNPSPTVTITTTPNTSICNGDSIKLEGQGATSYTWDNGVTDNVYFTPTSSGTYKVIGTDGNGCKDSTTQLITFNTRPTVGINYTGSSIICSGTSITLSGTGATNYTWNNGVQDGVAFTPFVTNTYTLTGDNGTGCPTTIDTTITVIAGPTVSASSGVTTICAGEQVTITSSGANTYSWDNGIGLGQTHTITPSTTTEYVVTGTQTASLCTDTDTLTIIVNPLPTVTANATPNDSLCLGDNLTLTGGGATSYTWDNGVLDGVVFTPTISSTGVNYEVIGTDANNCVNTAVVNVKVFNQPIITASVSPIGAICSGEQVILTGFGGLSYNWGSSGGTPILNGVAFIPPSGNNTFTVIATDINGCTGTAVQSVTVNPSPTVGAFSSAGGQTLCQGELLTLTATGNAQTYQWDNGVSNGVAFTPLVGTVLYTVTGTSSNLCESSASVSVIVNTQEDATITPILPLCGGVPLQTLETVTPGGIWQGVGVGSTSGTFDASIAGEGIHEVIYTTPGACDDADTIFIEVYPELIVSANIDSVCFGDSDGDIGVEVIQGVAPYSYLWETGEATSVLNGLGEGVYSVEVRDANNCIEDVLVSVFLTEDCDYHEFLPNVFSPNGDGLNDVFYVRGKGFESLSLVIFDRWGNKMFETTDKDIGWDGTNGGKKITSDVYIYHLKGKYYNGESFEKDGNVLLTY